MSKFQDLLGRPIEVGDTILVKGYGSCTNDSIAKVESIAKVNIYVNVPRYAWQRDPSTGYYIRVSDPSNTKRMARNPREVIVVNEQMAYNKENWPELFI